MSNPITNLIAEKGWCVADGATGSNFFGRGLEAGYPPDLWCVEKPDEVLWLHGAFLEAGAGYYSDQQLWCQCAQTEAP